jgi:hypothetical protein
MDDNLFLVNDRREQNQVCDELAPQSKLHFISQPWKALAYVLRLRNFENARLQERVESLEHLCQRLYVGLDEKQREKYAYHFKLLLPEQASRQGDS